MATHQDVSARTSAVYIFLRDDGIRKVGVSVDPWVRAQACKSATGVRHVIERIWETDYHAASRIESRTHRMLKPLKLRGVTAIELYPLSFEYLANVIRSVCQDMPEAIIRERSFDDLRSEHSVGGRFKHMDEEILPLQGLSLTDACAKTGLSKAGFTKRLKVALSRAAGNGANHAGA